MFNLTIQNLKRATKSVEGRKLSEGNFTDRTVVAASELRIEAMNFCISNLLGQQLPYTHKQLGGK